jgi:hypothetical protein
MRQREQATKSRSANGFALAKKSTLSASIPTRGITELFFRHIGVPDIALLENHDGS